MLISVYIQRTKCFYCVVLYSVLFGRPSHFFLAFVFILLLRNFNVWCTVWHVSGGSCPLSSPLSFVNKYKIYTITTFGGWLNQSLKCMTSVSPSVAANTTTNNDCTTSRSPRPQRSLNECTSLVKSSLSVCEIKQKWAFPRYRCSHWSLHGWPDHISRSLSEKSLTTNVLFWNSELRHGKTDVGLNA